jgi:predicted dehydrogenase
VPSFGDWRDMLDPDRIDSVVIATPPSIQPEITLAALDRGLCAFAEKPFALFIDAAQTLVCAAEASDGRTWSTSTFAKLLHSEPHTTSFGPGYSVASAHRR